MNIINDILYSFGYNNEEVNKLVINNTDFIEHYLHCLNSIPIIKIKKEYLNPLYYISKYSQIE
jgi:hypothetical protein